MNMPLVDKYDTQSAIELVRQAVDYHGWYDKHKILLKVRFSVFAQLSLARDSSCK